MSGGEAGSFTGPGESLICDEYNLELARLAHLPDGDEYARQVYALRRRLNVGVWTLSAQQTEDDSGGQAAAAVIPSAPTIDASPRKTRKAPVGFARTRPLTPGLEKVRLAILARYEAGEIDFRTMSDLMEKSDLL